MDRMLKVVALIFVFGAGAALALTRYELRPRHARLHPTTTGLPVESVTILSRSGASLAGWFLPGEGRGAVLLLHGAKSNRLVLVERMRMLREVGYSTLAIDFQAHGESSGEGITLGKLESLDARSALEWLRARLPGERLAVLGISMGGAAILIGDPINADAVVIESAYPDLASLVSNRLALLVGPLGRAITPFALTAMRVAAGIDASRLRPIDGIGRLHSRILIMVGVEDDKTTPEESQALFTRANEPKSYWEVSGAWHVDLAAIGGATYRERLLDFLGSTLRLGPDSHNALR
jgi:alpha-beta hydrolase superfamily lysophospholipase